MTSPPAQVRCLKTMEDWRDWQEYLAMAPMVAKGLRRTGGTLKSAVRIALRAIARDACGFEKGRYTQAELARLLTGAGFPCNVSNVKDAARRSAKFEPKVVLRTAETMRLAIALKWLFPAFQSFKFFAPETGPFSPEVVKLRTVYRRMPFKRKVPENAKTGGGFASGGVENHNEINMVEYINMIS